MKRITDEEISKAKKGNQDVIEDILHRCYGLVAKVAKKFFLAQGGDREDLIQEGLIGIYNGISTYDKKKSNGISFESFACICAERRMVSFLKSATRKRYTETFGVSLDVELRGGNPNSKENLKNLIKDVSLTPEEALMADFEAERFLSQLQGHLTKLEYNVFILHSRGITYAEIADKLKIDTKSVDNALTRVKRKARPLAGRMFPNAERTMSRKLPA